MALEQFALGGAASGLVRNASVAHVRFVEVMVLVNVMLLYQAVKHGAVSTPAINRQSVARVPSVLQNRLHHRSAPMHSAAIHLCRPAVGTSIPRCATILSARLPVLRHKKQLRFEI